LLIYDDVKRKEDEKTSILADIDFGIELMHTDKINVGYIMN
ncbi:type I restriction endonuclease subunit R, EcoR124 family, partial [Romboutsia sp. 13368]